MDTRDKTIIGITGVIFIIFVIVLLFVKKQFVSFSLGYLLLSIGGVFVLLTVVFVIYKLSFSKSSTQEKDDEKLPPAITRDEAYEIALLAVQKRPYLDYIDEYVRSDNVEELGEGKKNSIYTLYATRGVYVNEPYFVVINMHYPNKNVVILRNPRPVEIVRAKMMSAIHPEKPIDMRTTFNENPLLGTRQIVTEPIKTDSDKEKKKEDPLNK